MSKKEEKENYESKKASQKENHDRMKDISLRLQKGKPTTFQERNAFNIYLKRKNKKAKS